MPDIKVQEQMKCMMKHKIVMETLRIRHFFLFFKITSISLPDTGPSLSLMKNLSVPVQYLPYM